MSTETANALRAAKARMDTEAKWRASPGDHECFNDDAIQAFETVFQEFTGEPTHADIMALFDRAIAAEEAE